MTNIQLLLAASSEETKGSTAALIESMTDMSVQTVVSDSIQLLRTLEYRSDFSALVLDIELKGLAAIPDSALAMFDLPVLLLTPSLPYCPYSGNMEIVDFIEKPLTPFKVRQAELHLTQYLNKREAKVEPAQIPIVDENIEHLDASEILFIESLNRDVIVHTRERQLHTRISLKAYRNYLENGPFLSTHRSFLINLSKVERLDGENVYFADYAQPALIASDKRVDVSKRIGCHFESCLT